MTYYLLDEKLRDELLRYLFTRPCGEVMQGVLALQQLAPADKPHPEATKPAPEAGLR